MEERRVHSDAVAIAVLPFRHLSAGELDRAFALSFAEDLIANLSRFHSLHVLAAQSSFGLAQDEAADDRLREWGLDYLLQGSIRRSESAVRIAVQLVRVSDKRTLWTERFDAELDKLFRVQDDITATVAGRLAVYIDESRLGSSRRRTNDPIPAYDRWLRGMSCLRRGCLEGDEEARDFFQQALALDASYARAYAGLSLSHFNEWTCQAWHLWDESETNAFDYAARAAELDPTEAMVHSVLARVPCFRRRHEEAEHHIARALELNPNDAHVLIQAAVTHLFCGKPEEGLALADKAVRLNPLHGGWYLGIAGWNLFMLKRYEEAFGFLKQAGESIVNFAAYRAAASAASGEVERARSEYAIFEAEYQVKIAFGREPAPGEALRWAVSVEPFRRAEDSRHMPDLLEDAGIDAIDVNEALGSAPQHKVRPADVKRPPGSSFVRTGELWSIAYAERGANLLGTKGFHDLARLLAQPNEPVHCLELSGGVSSSDSQHELLDTRARREYRRRIEELQRGLSEAEARGDVAESERGRSELDALIGELARATGLGGRGRKMDDPAERARSSVTWRIRSAIKKIRAAHPALGKHLSHSIKTGYFCTYAPETPISWQL
jgi:TolB-like protein